MMIEDLSGLKENEILMAIKKCRKEHACFPMPSLILEAARPKTTIRTPNYDLLEEYYKEGEKWKE